MSTSTYSWDDAAVNWYGRINSSGGSTVIWTSAGAQTWFRFYGSLLEVHFKTGATAGLQVKIDGLAFATITTTTGSPSWTTVFSGTDDWHDVILTQPSGYNDGTFNKAAFCRVTSAGTEQIAAHPNSGPYERLGETPFTNWGLHTFPNTFTTGGYSSPSGRTVVTGTTATGGAYVARNASWTAGSKVGIWVASTGQTRASSLVIDGISYGTASTLIAGSTNNGFRMFDLPGSGSNKEIIFYNNTFVDAIMISDGVGGSGAYFESTASTPRTNKVVFTGDSQLQGIGSDSTTGAAHTFDALAFLRCNLTVCNVGISGNTIDQMTARFTADVTSNTPNYLLMAGGYNNVAGAAFVTAYKSFLNKAILDLPALEGIFCLKINDSWSGFADRNANIDTAVTEWVAANPSWAAKIVVIPNDPAGIVTDQQAGHISAIGYAQMYGDDTATINLTAQPADGDTITIVSGGNTRIYEFDNNASVASGNILVTIGASATATKNNLFNAMVTQFQAGFSARPLVSITDTYTLAGCAISKVSSIAKSGTNISVTGPFATGVGSTLQTYLGEWPIVEASESNSAARLLLLGVG